MDPHALINQQTHFPSENPSSCYSNLAEIWPFDVTNSTAGAGEFLGARRGEFGHSLVGVGVGGGYGEVGTVRNHDFTVDESTVTDPSERSGSNKKRDLGLASQDEPKLVSTSNGNVNGNEMTDNVGKRSKTLESMDCDSKAEGGVGSGFGNNKPAEQAAQPLEPSKQDYIHVRARRGQATDSHSLAERARREKISERMKILQDLVPGCNKVIGKALVLDEIINYIQSLQRQVEFLSMKLETVNSRINASIEEFPPKDTFETAGMTFVTHATTDFGQGSPPEWLHMQVGGGFERAA